jgi:hypothetical protein
MRSSMARQASGGLLVQQGCVEFAGAAAACRAPPLACVAGASVVEVGSGIMHVELADGSVSGACQRGRRNLRP